MCYYEELSYSISIFCTNSSKSDVNYTGSLKVNDAQDGPTGIIVEDKLFNITWCIKSVSSFQVDLNISNSIGDNIFSNRSKTLLIKQRSMLHILLDSVFLTKSHKAYHGT